MEVMDLAPPPVAMMAITGTWGHRGRLLGRAPGTKLVGVGMTDGSLNGEGGGLGVESQGRGLGQQ